MHRVHIAGHRTPRSIVCGIIMMLAMLAAPAGAFGQAINISLGTRSGIAAPPSAAYAAAGGQAGVWNTDLLPYVRSPLVTTAGGATGATLQYSGCVMQAYRAPDFGTGDYARLMSSMLYTDFVDGSNASTSVTIDGLSNGTYTVYIYIGALMYPGRSQEVFVTGGNGGTVTVAGTPAPDQLVLGVTHSGHQVTVTNARLGVSVTAALDSPATISGIQLVPGADVGQCAAVQPPAAQRVLVGGTAMFTAAVSGDIRGYRWMRNGADLADIRGIAGSSTPTLTLPEVRPGDAGQYALRYQCGGEWRTTPAATLTVVNCPADYNRNAATDITDIFAFLADWFAGCP